VPDLKLNEISDARERQAAQNGHVRPMSRLPGDPAAAAAALRAAAASATPRALWRHHRLFTILATLSLVPRVLAALAFRPAMLTSDSFLYMNEAAKGTLGQIRPSGYSWFLDIFQPLPHTLLAVTTVQHLMGIAIAAIVYGMLRYWGLPAWGACLAAAPTLFDTREIALESYILPDTLYTLMLLMAAALLLTKRTPRLWQCLLAGLFVAYVSVLRGNGLPLAVLFAIFILIRRVGWRSFTAAAVAFAIPLLAYVIAFNASYGKLNLTNSDGIFLWSRTTSFANCAIIKPPAQLRPLCPNLEKSVAPTSPAPAWSINGTLNEPTPADYLWAPDVWWRHDKYPGINKYNNKLGLHFAIKAIEAQPLDYLRVTARDVMLVFLSNDRPIAQSTMSFTITPHIAKLPSYYANDEYQYAGIRGNTYFVQPYAYFLFLYQLPVYLPGIVFFLVVVAGLVGVVRRWRSWGRLAALPWALAATSIVLPAMLTQSLYRYTIVAVPLACIAAGMAFLRPDPKLEPAASQAGAVPVPVPAADITSPAAADITTLPPSAEPASAEPAPPDTARADAAATADADADDMAGDSRPADPARADPPESDGQASGNGSSPADPADVPDP
jgi:hypothetical protein